MLIQTRNWDQKPARIARPLDNCLQLKASPRKVSGRRRKLTPGGRCEFARSDFEYHVAVACELLMLMSTLRPRAKVLGGTRVFDGLEHLCFADGTSGLLS